MRCYDKSTIPKTKRGSWILPGGHRAAELNMTSETRASKFTILILVKKNNICKVAMPTKNILFY